MSKTRDINLAPGQTLGGFRVRTITPVEELRAVACECEHVQSGAKLLHLCCDDAENLFSVNFRTPAPDDTGVPHIIEHSVLAGSRKYPVRDPFFEMVKMSMATFINAMTGEDCTYYPVCSNVKKDLFNLADVYFDAVFSPRLTPETLMKEGHHLVPADPSRPIGGLKINGIVYNEMKSALSMPESLLYYRAKQRLMPDSVYARNSGGDPDFIPDLTYDGFRRFYELTYHPANAFFVLYGDIPTEEYLEFLDGRLAAFGIRDTPPAITRQPRWTEHREATATYPISPGEKDTEKTFVSLEWLVGRADDPEEAVTLYVLGLILLGNEAAPLKKAIISSRLGQDLVHSGPSSHGFESTFRVGIKGSEPDRGAAFRELVERTLTDLAGDTFDPALVDAAFHQASYFFREVNTLYPLGVMQRVLESWIHGGDPLAFLGIGAHLETCRARCAEDPRHFNKLLGRWLAENPHRLLLVLRPDRKMQQHTDADFAARMQEIRSRLSDDEMQAIATQGAELERSAGAANSPEALATLPQLSRNDLPRKPRHVPTVVEDLGEGVLLLCNDVFSNGVNYLRMEIDLRGLPAALWPYVPRYTGAVGRLGAAGMGYERIAQRVAANTGGVWCHPQIRTHIASPARPAWGLVFGLKALDDQIEPALNLLHDLFFGLDPRDATRLKDVTAQALASLRTHLVQGGPRTAVTHAARGLSPEGHIAHTMHGLPQLPLVEDLAKRFDDAHGELMAKIEAVRDFAASGERVTASFTGSSKALDKVRNALRAWRGRMGRRSPVQQDPGFRPFDEVPREGLAAPIQVAHCVQLVPAPHGSSPDAPLLRLATNLLRVDYMYHELRFKGNAYGAMCSYSDSAGLISLGSYADPHVVRTLGVFADLPEHVRGKTWTPQEFDRALISTAKQHHRPIRPEAATGEALDDHARGITPELIDAQYEAMLGASAADVKRAILTTLEANLSRAPVCVVAGREKLEAANEELGECGLKIRDILE